MCKLRRHLFLLSNAAALCAALLPGAAGAQEPLGPGRPYQWRLEPHDATNTELARQTRIDWDYVNGKKPSYAERRGLSGAPTVEIRRNYVYVEDTDQTLNIPYRSQRDIGESFNFALREVYNVLPQEHVFIYLFTSFPTGVGAYFYQHQANSIRGIGLPSFDNNGGSPLEGFIFMNDWQSFEDQWSRFGREVVVGFSRSVFNQEAGHRWIVTFDGTSGQPPLLPLLGRDDAHWSYFMDSSASPMEGNWWRDNGNGTFTTRTTFNNWYFNDLDLYLMGLLPTESVRPWFLITDVDAGNARDIYGQALNPASPPQITQPLTVRGRRVEYGIGDVTSQLGGRFPVAGQDRTRFKVVFVMLAGGNYRLAESQRREFEDMVDSYATGFKEGARNLAELDYRLAAAPPRIPIGGICSSASECDSTQAPECTAPAGASSFCTLLCATNDPCPPNWCCGAASDGRSVCLPPGFCPMGPNPGVDAGMSSMPDTGAPPAACACDTTYACDADCGCDPECFRQPGCTCDQTFSCDPDCSCDPECSANAGGGSGRPTSLRTKESSCACASLDAGSPRGLVAFLLLTGLVVGLRRRR